MTAPQLDSLTRSADEFLAGETGLSGLRSALAEALAAPDADREAVVAVLDHALERGLPEPLHRVLAGEARTRFSSDVTATVLAPAPKDTTSSVALDDDTEIAPTTGAKALASPPALAEDGATTLNPDTGAPTATGALDPADDVTRAAATAVPAVTDIAPVPASNEGSTPRTQTSPGTGQDAEELHPGSRLRNRFELIELLGEGGMGAVWKGIDQLKVEARDRNPYVAIKLLSGDFREHPESFIALQRETAKQQRLAHPNIATVHDFDRDEQRNLVFMTMEVLEGQSLDQYIRDLPEGGLPFDEAMAIVSQLAAGLQYAHGNNLVHSDLKPSNCFLTREGNVKLLDFGIARASKTQADAEGDKTLFDPGALGALTPAYATVEMFEGEDPAPSDDVYALAVIAYQLLSGQHPYQRRTAPQALAAQMTPAPLPGLSRRQNRALSRALALERANRTPGVSELLEQLSPAQRHLGWRAALVVAALVLAVPGYQWAVSYWAQYNDEATVTLLESGPDQLALGLERLREEGGQLRSDTPALRQRAELAIGQFLIEHNESRDPTDDTTDLGTTLQDLFQGLGPGWREAVLARDAVREGLITDGRKRLEEAFDPAAGHLDYRQAREILTELRALFPGSASVMSLGQSLDGALTAARVPVQTLLESLTSPDARLPALRATEARELIETYRAIEPTNPWFRSPATTLAVIAAGEASLDGDTIERSVLALEVARALGASTSDIAGLEQAVAARRAEQQRAARLAELREKFSTRGSAASVGSSLPDFDAIRAELIEFSGLAPGDEGLTALLRPLPALLSAELAAARDQGRPAAGLGRLADFAPVLTLDYIRLEREPLWQSTDPSRIREDEERRRRMAPLAASINAQLRQPGLDSAWEARFDASFKPFLALAEPGDAGVGSVTEGVALLYRDRALERLASGDVEGAARAISQGLSYRPGDERLRSARQDIATQLAVREREQQEADRDAEIESRLARLIEHTASGEPEAALAELVALAGLNAGQDPDVAAAAGPALALVSARAGEDFQAGLADEAERLTQSALTATEGWPGLETARRAVREHAKQAEAFRDLQARLLGEEPLPDEPDLSTATSQLNALREDFPTLYEQLYESALAHRQGIISDALSTVPPDAERLSDATRELEGFAAKTDLRTLREAFGTRLAGEIRTAAEAEPMLAHDLVDAGRFIATARAVRKVARALPPVDLARGQAQLDSGRLTAAEASLRQAQATNPRSGKVVSLLRKVQREQQAAKRTYRSYLLDVRGGRLADEAERTTRLAAIQATWTDNPEFVEVGYVARRAGACWQGLAGLGAQPEGVCSDQLADGRRGPDLVIVGDNASGTAPLAVMKFELEAAEFARYCAQTNRCNWSPPADSNLPATGLSAAQAKAYAAWLSAQVSRSPGKPLRYRLPTVAEWQAIARGPTDRPGVGGAINCRRQQASGGAVITRSGGSAMLLGADLGGAMREARLGEPNGFGAVNAVGNAREWVTEGSRFRVAGGSYRDSVERCGANLIESHAGEADEMTGIRLVRDLTADEL